MVVDYRIKGVYEMNFDLSWFATIPGLFITGGVILLIVALVILIVTGKKTKKEKTEMENNGVQQAPGVAAPINMPGVVNPMIGNNVIPPVDPTLNVQPVMPVNTMPNVGQMPEQNMGTVSMAGDVNSNLAVTPNMGASDLGVSSVMPESMPPIVDPMSVGMPTNNVEMPIVNSDVNVVDPSANVVAPSVEIPTVSADPVAVAPVDVSSTIQEPVVYNAPIVDVQAPVNNVDSVASVSPVVSVDPVMPQSVDQVSSIPNVQVTPSVVPEPVAVAPVEPVVTQPDSQPVIYGGVSPTVGDVNINQDNNHQIYGGADPLQNTQSIPAVVPVEPIVVQNEEPVMSTSEVVQPVVPEIAPVVVPVGAS